MRVVFVGVEVRVGGHSVWCHTVQTETYRTATLTVATDSRHPKEGAEENI